MAGAGVVDVGEAVGETVVGAAVLGVAVADDPQADARIVSATTGGNTRSIEAEMLAPVGRTRASVRYRRVARAQVLRSIWTPVPAKHITNLRVSVPVLRMLWNPSAGDITQNDPARIGLA